MPDRLGKSIWRTSQNRFSGLIFKETNSGSFWNLNFYFKYFQLIWGAPMFRNHSSRVHIIYIEQKYRVIFLKDQWNVLRRDFESFYYSLLFRWPQKIVWMNFFLDLETLNTFSNPGWLSRSRSWSSKEGTQALSALPYSIAAFLAKTNIVCSQCADKLPNSLCCWHLEITPRKGAASCWRCSLDRTC